MFDYEGIRWVYTFLRTSSYLSREDREDLLVEATILYLMGQDEKPVKGGNYEGWMRNMKTIGVFGSFVGIKFEAELDTVYGKDKMEFIINEQTPGRQMHYSPN